jgi:hypothetical protein
MMSKEVPFLLQGDLVGQGDNYVPREPVEPMESRKRIRYEDDDFN